MTVQNLYTQYLEGKITESKFLYEVRRDQNLDMISPTNSFADVVKILKNKSIISEKAAKESTGKQEVEIVAKTIDMVNPYEYSRGMNYELGIMDIPATGGDLSEDNMLKAQKKVLANLTKNPQYYCEKMHGKGEVSDEWVEVTKKEIDKIGKGKASKIIREGLGHNEISSIHQEGNSWIVTYRTMDGTKEKSFSSEEEARKFYNGLNEHGQYYDRVADVNADSSPLKEEEKAIYEKYSAATGIPVENLMSMVREAKSKIKEDTFLGKDSIDDLKRHPKYSTLSSDGKKNAEDDLKNGGSVTIG